MVLANSTDLSFGASISNFGQKLTYSTEDNENFLPTNLRLGTAFTTEFSQYNKVTLAIDVNKLMVPSPPNSGRALLRGTFGSFGDAPGGSSEEFKEIMYSFGLEYWYRDVFGPSYRIFFLKMKKREIENI